MKRVTLISMSIVFASVALLVYSQEHAERNASFDTVEARKFIVRDSKGRVRAQLQVDDNDLVSLNLLNAGSGRQFTVFVHADGTTFLGMSDRAGSQAIRMVAGGPSDVTSIELNPQTKVILHNYHFSPVATLGMSTNNVPYLELMRPLGRVRLTVGMSDNATPCLEFLGWQGR